MRETWSLHSGRWQFSGLGYSYKAAGPELDPEDFLAQDQGQEAELCHGCGGVIVNACICICPHFLTFYPPTTHLPGGSLPDVT